MFLLPTLAVGLALALVLGGRPSKLAEVRLRATAAVALSLGLQLVLFTGLGSHVGHSARAVLHVVSYVLLAIFAAANRRVRSLFPVYLGMALNGIAITANGGSMPLSEAAARAAGLPVGVDANVSADAHRLWFLGDVFALPARLPLANAFSVGDLLIGVGMITFVVLASTDRSERVLDWGRLVQPFRTTSYRRLALGSLISSLGDWLTLVTLVGWLYQSTGSTQDVAVLLLIRLAPLILGGGLAAMVVDRAPKQRLLSGVEIARGVLVAGALVAVASDVRVAVFAMLVCSTCLAAISNAAASTTLPSLLPSAELASANAGLAVAKDGAMALGALGAGVALSSVGATPALAADVLSFAVAAALFSTLRVPRISREPKVTNEQASSIRYLLRTRSLLLLTLSFAAATVATGLTNATLPRLFSGLGFGAGGYGFAIGALAIGLTLGQALVGFVQIGEAAARWIGAGLLGMAGLFTLLGLVQHGPTALIVLAAIGVIDGTTDVVFQTLVQREADPRHLGAVFGFSSALYTATMLGAVALAPLANTVLPASGVVIGASAFLAVGSATALLVAPRVARARPSAVHA